jgi:hypothetical protein
MPSDDVMVEKLLLTGRKHLQLNVLFIGFHKYVNCDYCHCSLIRLNSNVFAQPTVLNVSHCIVEINQNFSLLSPCLILSASIRCMCRASLLFGHTSCVSVGFLLVSYHLGKASQPCKLILSRLDCGHGCIQTEYVDLPVSFITVFHSFLLRLTALKTVVFTKSCGCLHALRPRYFSRFVRPLIFVYN